MSFIQLSALVGK